MQIISSLTAQPQPNRLNFARKRHDVNRFLSHIFPTRRKKTEFTARSDRHMPGSKRKATAWSQAHETLGAMTTVIMRTSDDNRMWSFLALFQGFPFLGNLPITLVFHTANRDSKRLPFPGAVADIARIKRFHRWPQVLILRFPWRSASSRPCHWSVNFEYSGLSMRLNVHGESHGCLARMSSVSFGSVLSLYSPGR